VRHPIGRLFSWIREKIAHHPPPAELLALVDGELTLHQAIEVWKHVEVCTICRRTTDKLRQGLQAFKNFDSGFRVPKSISKGGFELLRDAIVAWHLANPEPQTESEEAFIGSPLFTVLAAELSIYLGPPTAANILGKCCTARVDSKRLVAEMEPMLTSFLGQRSASAVLTKVLLLWDTAHGQAASGSPA
jgi:hypothetical protein